MHDGSDGSSRTENADVERMEDVQVLLGPAFARKPAFWASTLIAALGGVVMGLCGLAFFNAWTWAFDTWITDEYREGLETGRWVTGSGHWWWMAYIVGGGAIVGLIWILPGFPQEVHGLFREVKDLHVEVVGAPLVVLASAVSIAAGASVGPEAALGTLGGAVGMVLGGWRPDVENRRNMATLVCMAGAMGSLLPTPLLSVIIMHELNLVSNYGDSKVKGTAPGHGHSGAGRSFSSTASLASLDGSDLGVLQLSGGAGGGYPYGFRMFAVAEDAGGAARGKHHDWMEQVTLMGFAAAAAYTTYFGLVGYTYVDPEQLPIAVVDLIKLDKDLAYERWYIGASVLLGVLSGALGLITVVWMGAARQIGDRLVLRLQALGAPRRVAIFLRTIVAAAIIGVVSVQLPLTLGDGGIQLGSLIRFGTKGYGTGGIWALMFAKIFLLGLSLGFGFVGGQIFPCMFVGTCAGILTSHYWPDLPMVLTLPCMVAAVPCSFAPLPLTFVLLIEYVFELGSEYSAPVLVSCIVAFLTSCGVGVAQSIISKSIRRLRQQEMEKDLEDAPLWTPLITQQYLAPVERDAPEEGASMRSYPGSASADGRSE